MESELCVQPLEIRKFWLGCRYWLKAAAVSDNPTFKLIDKLTLLDRYWKGKNVPIMIEVHKSLKKYEIHKSLKLGMFSLNVWVSSLDIKSAVHFSLDSLNVPKRKVNTKELMRRVVDEIRRKYLDYYKLFTDGSKGPPGVGAAFYDPQANLSMKFKLNSAVCVMRAELIAIVEALSYARSVDINKVVILSDSRSALQHLARCVSGTRGMPIAYEALKLIDTLQEAGVCVELQWIPSHVGIYENEIVDDLAKSAVVDGVELSCLPLNSEILIDVRALCREKWEVIFNHQSITKGIWYRSIQNIPPAAPWFDCVSLTRDTLVTALRLRSGHLPLNKFYHLVGVRASPLCEACQKPEDILHLLVECDQYTELRGRLMCDINLYNGQLNVILAKPTSRACKKIFDFVKLCMNERRQREC